MLPEFCLKCVNEMMSLIAAAGGGVVVMRLTI